MTTLLRDDDNMPVVQNVKFDRRHTSVVYASDIVSTVDPDAFVLPSYCH